MTRQISFILNETTETPRNLLPKDGCIQYFGQQMSPGQANAYFEWLLDCIAWRADEVVIAGKQVSTGRQIAWYGDRKYHYRYSGTTKIALPWAPELLQLKTIAERVTGHCYNSCLLNLYHDGSQGMAWHSDAEKDLLPNGAIASISLGATRKFALKHKTTKETISLFLEHGSVLLMSGEIQQHWLHRLPPTKKVLDSRINLTFRTIVQKDAEPHTDCD